MMNPLRPHWIALALGPLFALAACAPRQQVQSSPPPATADQTHIAKAKADSARYPYTEADVRFMSAMIGHHAQALEMSALAPTRAASPSVRTLAERIINGQQDEILTMQRWLGDRRQPVPEVAGMKTDPSASSEPGPSQAKGHSHSGHAGQGMLMPGMLTEAQMQELKGAKGPEFDRLFLTFMIQHHRGAVSMVKDLFASRGAAQDETVFKFANDVSVDQSTEIERMEKMLAAQGSSSGSR